ncbi:TDT family transporter [Streptomyces galbus]|uniref:C4-dicarboxylate ABC transporter n=1 Tax=Streptomyces galbus TaxID=33898 RepID=A0A4U5WXV4_STRGB|nr:TDT family transporter [Streptomyces galbus]TKT07427.1 C4-dicarboxylate ABC transporter [Streptomyces galbus]GHD37008.1 C4-dicarboxylate ABC transporter [Streptomyces galbus]
MVTAAQPLAPSPGRSPAVRPAPRLPALRHLGPNWYACVMGTAIVATAGAALPLRLPGLGTAWAAVWALSLVLLVVLLVARGLHWAHHRDQARAHLLDPSAAPFYGCLAMALLAVGGGALGVGREWIGTGPAVALDAVLFGAGTAVGLAAAVAVPYLMAVRQRPRAVEPGQATPVWLLPLVAPMVSAALGPALVPYLPAGQARATLLLGCVALFGLSLLATFLMLPLVFARLVTRGPLPLALTPTLFLVLGPLGQSTTAVGRFADVAPGVVPAPYADGFRVLAVLYGVPVTGFALLWLGLATAHVVRARRHGMGFSMTWWAFTFPVGTCVTGAAALARHTGLVVYGVLAVALYALLVGAWGVAAVRTAGGLLSGALLAGPRPAPGAPR